MSEELKPCGHCGGAVTWCECDKCGRIWCPACGIMTEFSPPDSCDTLEKEREFTAERWNRRATPPAPSTAQPMGYAMFRDGKQVGIEQNEDQTAYWLNAVAVPLGPIRAPSTAREADERESIETAAKAIYRLFDLSDIHPWVEGGNSHMQNDARRYARAALAAKTSDTPQTQPLCDSALRAEPAGQHDVDEAAERKRFDAWADEKGLLPHARGARWDGWIAGRKAEAAEQTRTAGAAKGGMHANTESSAEHIEAAPPPDRRQEPQGSGERKA